MKIAVSGLALTAIISQVDALTNTTCSFVATAETIAGLFTNGNIQAQAGVAVATQIANIICSAAKANLPPAGIGAAVPGADIPIGTYNGVPIVGHFVN